MKKLFSVLIILTIVSMAGWLAYKRITTSAKKRPGRSAIAVAVEIQQIRKGVIKDIGIFTGSLFPKSQFVVAPKVAGWLQKLLVNVGDMVRQNQVIAILDDKEFTQQVEQAKAELQVAKANAENCSNDLDLAQREYERAKALREKQIASASELEEAEAAFKACQTKLKVSLAQMAQKESELAAAELRLSYTRVQAFWETRLPSGLSLRVEDEPGQKNGDEIRVVGERFVDEGALLQANQPIVSILENKPLTAVVYVVERDYPKIKVGQESIVTTDAYPNKTFPGSVVRIAPLLQESSRQARVEIEISNREELLRPGMFIRARIEFASHDNATIVPLAALVKRNDRQGVFIAARDPSDQRRATSDELRARFIPVTVGIISGESAEIIEPPRILVEDKSGGSKFVVTMGNHLLEDGSAITLPESKPAEAGKR